MTEELTLEQLEEQLGKKKKKRKRLLLLLLLLLLLTAAVVVTIVIVRDQMRPKSQWELDREALEGFLSTHTQEEIEAELNRIIEKGRFNISLNPTLTVAEDGKANVMLENVPANHYWMRVTIYYLDNQGQEQELYRSGIIQQGYCIEEATITGRRPPAGEYNGRAVFSAIMPESDEEVGQSAATLVIRVQ